MRHIVWFFVLCSGCMGSPNRAKTPDVEERRPMAPAQPASALTEVYRDPGAPVEKRVEDLLARMTPAEKAEMLAGSGWMESRANARLGIPAIKMADGPMGVRDWSGPSSATNAGGVRPVTSTAFPAGIAMAATWDVELVRVEGRAIAQQVKALGRDMILGPTLNIQRTPLWGRNFEGYGEDPYLAARMAVAYIEGVQGEGVIATAKHLAANNQEYERHRIDEQIELRTLHEIYLPAFKAAVQEAKVLSVMSAYNRINGHYCAENAWLLTEVLKQSWGFRGFVVSDWGSTYSTAGSIRAGLDLEMPGGDPMRAWSADPNFRQAGHGAGWLTADRVNAALAAHQVELAAVDDSVRRMLRAMFTVNLFDRKPAGGGEVDTAEQRAVARQAAAESIVLLKNDRGLLPLGREHTRSIAIIGPNAAVARAGGGSSQVRPKYAVSPVNGLMRAAGPAVQISYALGATMPGDDTSGSQTGDARALRQAAVALAAKSEVAIVVVGNAPQLESEGFDRPSMDLPPGQDELIASVAAANPKTIVVVVAGAPVTMTRWVQNVSAVLYAWYGGQELGNALGDLVFGLAEPSGKLPVTLPKRLEDNTAFGNYPGQNLGVRYAEGIYVGYRGFDRRRVEPLFPFGHGLAYTKFEYGGLELRDGTPKVGDAVSLSLRVKNVGPRAGTEVVQLYLRDVECSLDRPEKELKGFRRVFLQPGETRDVTFTVDRAAMAFFDPKQQAWVVEPGTFEVLIGSSARDIRLRKAFKLAAAR